MSQCGHMVVNILHIPQTCVVFSCVLNDAMDCWMAEWKKKITLQRRRAAQSPFVSQQMKIVQSKLSGEQKKWGEKHFPLQRVLTGSALLNTIPILRISSEWRSTDRVSPRDRRVFSSAQCSNVAP